MRTSVFTFIDLFSGIGGFHLGLSRIGGECLMASDIDTYANQSYQKNFAIVPKGDIREIKSGEIPAHDVLCAGFPCQAFSHIGQKGGFSDPRGEVVFEVFRILRSSRRPKAFILENVKGLINHNNGLTFRTIQTNLEKCGYTVYHDILEAKDYDLPQIRKRLFIVGILKRYQVDFRFPEPVKNTKLLCNVVGGKTERDYAFTIRVGGRHSGLKNKFNWDCYLVNGKEHYLTVEECLELQGFPRTMYLAGNTTEKLKQIGNSVPVNIISAIGKSIIDTGIFKID